MIHYQILNSHVDCELGRYDSYGISVNDGEKEIRRFEDLTFDFSEIEHLVSLCNKEKVELVHIEDIVENFLLPDV